MNLIILFVSGLPCKTNFSYKNNVKVYFDMGKYRYKNFICTGIDNLMTLRRKTKSVKQKNLSYGFKRKC